MRRIYKTLKFAVCTLLREINILVDREIGGNTDRATYRHIGRYTDR